MTAIDVFAHVLLPDFYRKMLAIDATIPEKFPFIQHPHLTQMEERRKCWDGQTRQVISSVNINPEDYLPAEEAALLCQKANQELMDLVEQEADLFEAGVAMLPMNHIEAALELLEKQVAPSPSLVGVQVFTRALGKSIAEEEFRPIFAKCAQLNLPIWLHPVFDERKPDNNIVFSWEYELAQAMLQLVQAGLFQAYPDLKIIVHHAGAMIPYFAGRIETILPEEQAQDFQKFYVDTAILGNPKALELAIDYFGVERVLFGTDAPLGIAPAGASQVILEAIDALGLSRADKDKVLFQNFRQLLGESHAKSN